MMQRGKDPKAQGKSHISEAASTHPPAGLATTEQSNSEHTTSRKEGHCNATPHACACGSAGRDPPSQGGIDSPLVLHHLHHDRGSPRAAAPPAARTVHAPQQETQEGGRPGLLVMGRCCMVEGNTWRRCMQSPHSKATTLGH